MLGRMTHTHKKNHRDLALEQIDIAHAVKLELDDLRTTPDDLVGRSRSSRIADAHTAIGHALKLAEIHASLAVAEATARRDRGPGVVAELTAGGGVLITGPAEGGLS